MTSNNPTYDDVLICCDVDDGERINMFWDGDEWLVVSQSPLQKQVRDALNDIIISELDLGEWLEAPKTGEKGQIMINEVAFISEDDDVWIVDISPPGELQVTV